LYTKFSFNKIYFRKRYEIDIDGPKSSESNVPNNPTTERPNEALHIKVNNMQGGLSNNSINNDDAKSKDTGSSIDGVSHSYETKE